MERKDIVAALALSWDADIANHAADTSPWSEDAGALEPSLIEFSQECFVIINSAHLRGVRFVFLEVPVRRRRDDKVDALGWEPGEIAGVAAAQLVSGFVERFRPGEMAEDGVGAEHAFDRTFGV